MGCCTYPVTRTEPTTILVCCAESVGAFFSEAERRLFIILDEDAMAGVAPWMEGLCCADLQLDSVTQVRGVSLEASDLGPHFV